MCDTCGCSDSHGHHHEHEHDHGNHHGHGHQHAHAPASRVIDIGAGVMARNDEFAAANRERFAAAGLYAVNLISSPGAGKTTLLEALAAAFGERMAVIEGEIRTSRDSERVIRAGSRAWQIETGGACHLDAHGVGHALEHLDLDGVKLLVIENVGNLVCPATYELGEHEKMAILSTPEGDDKVLKYPALFHRIGTLVINKIDLAAHVDFDTSKAVHECRSLNRGFQCFPLSAKTGEGMPALLEYLGAKAGI